MIPVIATELSDNLDEIKEAAEQMKDADPSKVQEYFEELLPKLVDFGLRIVLAFVIYFVGSKVIRLLRKLLGRFLDRANVDEGVKQFLDSFAKVLLYFVLIVLLCGWLGIPTTSAAALLGSVALTIGLALQGSLSNFAGGVLILLLHLFRVGDYIIEDTGKNEGTVVEISLFYTRLLTQDHKIVVLPNGTLANASLTNVSSCDKLRISIMVYVPYGTDLKKAREILLTTILKNPYCQKGEDNKVYVAELGETYVRFECEVWVAQKDAWPLRYELTEQLEEALSENGIQMACNQVEVRVADHEK